MRPGLEPAGCRARVGTQVVKKDRAHGPDKKGRGRAGFNCLASKGFKRSLGLFLSFC